jgi:hypothetical protein
VCVKIGTVVSFLKNGHIFDEFVKICKKFQISRHGLHKDVHFFSQLPLGGGIPIIGAKIENWVAVWG